MSYARRYTVAVTTDTDGAGSGLTPIVNGKIINLAYTKDGTAPYTDGVDFTVTLAASGQAVWTGTDVNASVTVAPRQATHDTAGVASTYDGAEPVEDSIWAGNDKVQITVASGGDSKVGSFEVIVS